MHTKELTARRPTVALSGLDPYRGTFGKNELIHLLKRTMFGAKRADLAFFAGKSLDEVVDTLLTEPPYPEPPINNYNTATKIDPRIPAGQVWIYDTENADFNGERRNSLRAWWAGNMVNQTRSIREKMVLFWHNHFATEMNETSAMLFVPHVTTLYKHALGNFKTLTRDITLDPNMLRYLNGYLNVRTAPDENYARELQELFCLGKGPNSQYTEDDVRAAARVLTGWKIRTEQYRLNPNDPNEPLKNRWSSYFLSSVHDTTNKQFSSFYGNRVITGRSGATAGDLELDDLLDMIFAEEEVAYFICRKIYRFFVYYEIDATVEAEVIAPMAAILRNNNYNILPVLSALFKSSHFYDVAHKGIFIKSPLDYVIAIAREFDMVLPDANDYVYQYAAWGVLIGTTNNGAAAQGQTLGDPPSVAGWPAYYQEPVYHEFWINTDSLPRRLKFVDALFTNTGVRLAAGRQLIVDVLKFTADFTADISDPNILIDETLGLLMRVPVSNSFKAYLKTTFLLGGQDLDHYWSDAWNDYVANPTSAAAATLVRTRLQAFYRYIVDTPEFQLS